MIVKKISYILKMLYRLSQSNDRYYSIEEIYPDSPELDIILKDVKEALIIMENRGWIHTVKTDGAGPVTAKILPDGKIIFETINQSRSGRLRELQRILGVEKEPNVRNIINIKDISGSNIAILSTDTQQTIEVKPQIENKLNEIYDNLKSDSSISEEKFEELSLDIETIKTELSKIKPNKKIIDFILDNFNKIKSITKLVGEATKLIMILLGS